MTPARILANSTSKAALCLFVALLTTAAQAASEPPPFGPADVFGLEWATSPRISPDGDAIVYVRNGFDARTDRRRSDLWLIDGDGAATPLTPGFGNHGSPRFSPDGERLAWIAATDEGAEIFVRWLASGQVARLTQLPHAPRSLSWSPDGTQLAFVMHVDADPVSTPSLPAKPDGADWAPDARVVTDLTWRADGRGLLRRGFTHVFVVPASGGSARQLTSGDFHHDGGLAWLPSGEALVVSANRRDDAEYLPQERDLWRVDLDGDLTRLTDRDGPEVGPVVAADASTVAFRGFEDALRSHQTTQAWALDLDSGEISALTPSLDRSVRDLHYDADGNLFFAYSDHGRGVVARRDRRGRITVIAEDLGGTSIGRPYAGGDLHANARGEITYTQADASRPADVGRRGRSGAAVRLTRLNDDLLPWRDLAAVQEVTFEGEDGTALQGWFVPALGANAEPAPLVLEIHGGPHTAYGPVFSPEVQLYAAAGYSVLYMNPRGSTSYGEAFADAIDEAYPGVDYGDLMAGVDHVIALGLADPDALFVTGGSGGGVLSAWIVGTTDRFRAAVVAKPVINWQSFTLTADMSAFAARYWFPAMPWEDPEHYWQRSPLSRVGNVSTPTMVLTGENDLRTPMSESEQYYQALRLRGIDTALVRIQDAGHGIAARPSNLLRKVGWVTQWFDDHGGRGEADTQP